MNEESMKYDKQTMLFTQLVLSFQASAWQQMGKVMNIFTQKIERDLDQAQMSIDMLAMLQDKTRGNLSDEETRLMDRVLFELRMNYVDEVEKDKTKTGQEGIEEPQEHLHAEREADEMSKQAASSDSDAETPAKSDPHVKDEPVRQEKPGKNRSASAKKKVKADKSDHVN